MTPDPDIPPPRRQGSGWSVSDLARAQGGLSKQDGCREGRALRGAGLLATRTRQGTRQARQPCRVRRAAGQTTDLGRERGAATKRAHAAGLPSGATGTDPVYSRSRPARWPTPPTARKIALGIDLKLLVPVEPAAGGEFAGVLAPIRTRLDRLQTRAADCAAAVAEGGERGAAKLPQGARRRDLERDSPTGRPRWRARSPPRRPARSTTFNPRAGTPEPEPDEAG